MAILGGGAILAIPQTQVEAEMQVMQVSNAANAAGLALDTPVFLVQERQSNGSYTSKFIMLDGTAIAGLLTTDVKFVQPSSSGTPAALPVSVGEALLAVDSIAQKIPAASIPPTAKSAVVSFLATSDMVLWTKATGLDAVSGSSTPTQGGGIFELQSPQDLSSFSFVCPTAISGSSGSNASIYIEFRA